MAPGAGSKAALRSRLRFRRDAFVAGLDLAGRLATFRRPPHALADAMADAGCVAGYCAMGSEADPARLLDHAAAAGLATALPYHADRNEIMQFRLWSPGDPLARGPFGTDQPLAASRAVVPGLILVPLVGFDRTGARLGQGQGHFDRALATVPDALRVGLGWAVQEIDAIPTDPWDIPLNAILTEVEWIEIGASA